MTATTDCPACAVEIPAGDASCPGCDRATPELLALCETTHLAGRVLRHRARLGPIPAAGRNDPCPCGSGAKYKRCHGR